METVQKQLKVFENKNSRIIYSFNDRGKRASISTPGKKVKDSEIDYVISEIMKVDHTTVTGYISSNGVYHLKCKTFGQHEQYAVSDILQ